MRTQFLAAGLAIATLASCSTVPAGSDGGAALDDRAAPGDVFAAPDDGSGSADSTAGDGGADAQVHAGSDLDSRTYGRDGAGIGGASGTPFAFDVASRYAGDTAFRAAIANYGQMRGNPLYASFDPSKAGTGDRNSALYTDGVNPDLIDWVPAAGPGGDAAFVLTVKALDVPGESPTPQLATSARGAHSVWLWVRRRYDPGFSAFGDADDVNGAMSWNATQGAGLKIGPYASYGYHDNLAGAMYYGRAGLQSGNGTARSTADYDLVNLPQGTPQPTAINDTRIASVTTEWTDGVWRDYLVYVGNTVGSDGVIHVAAQVWTRTLGDSAAFVPLGARLTGVIGATTRFERPTFAEIMPFMLNANHARRTDEHFRVWGWAAFDADAVPDPFGVLAR